MLSVGHVAQDRAEAALPVGVFADGIVQVLFFKIRPQHFGEIAHRSRGAVADFFARALREVVGEFLFTTPSARTVGN